MWTLWRLWAMLILLLVEPWRTGYHHPYHHSPKLRKIQQPKGKRLHIWAIQRRLWNCANTERSKAASSITRTDTIILFSTNPRYRKNKAAADVKDTETEQVRKPSAITHRVDQTFYTHVFAVLSSHWDSLHLRVVFCCIIRKKNTKTHKGSVLQGWPFLEPVLTMGHVGRHTLSQKVEVRQETGWLYNPLTLTVIDLFSATIKHATPKL